MQLGGLIPGPLACKSNALPLHYNFILNIEYKNQSQILKHCQVIVHPIKSMLGSRIKVFLNFFKNLSWNLKNFFLYDVLHMYAL